MNLSDMDAYALMVRDLMAINLDMQCLLAPWNYLVHVTLFSNFIHT